MQDYVYKDSLSCDFCYSNICNFYETLKTVQNFKYQKAFYLAKEL